MKKYQFFIIGCIVNAVLWGIIIVIFCLLFCSCSPTAPELTADIYGEAQLFMLWEIKHSGRVEMQYADNTYSSELVWALAMNNQNIYDFKFENIVVSEGEEAVFTVLILNDSLEEESYGSKTAVLKTGYNKIEVTIIPFNH